MLKKISLFFILLTLSVFKVSAQCAMCRAQLESMDDNALAKSVNDGIVYLMAVPYILIALVGFFVYRSFQKKSNKTT
jgi:amino acid permease